MKLLLATSNVMTSSATVRRFSGQKSNMEIISGLKSNFAAAEAFMEHKSEERELQKNSERYRRMPVNCKQWTSLAPDGSTLYVPCEEFVSALSGLAEEREQYDITVKLFFLPGGSTERRCRQITEAVSLVCKELRVDSIDLLIVSWSGVTFDGGVEGAGDNKDDLIEKDDLIARTATTNIPTDHCSTSLGQSRRCSLCQDILSPAATFEGMLTTWRALESLVDLGAIRRLGLAEFNSARLAAFLSHVRIAPAVDQIYVRDCCVVPRDLIVFAKERGIQLLTHNDCTDILPKGTIRGLLSSSTGQKGAGAGVLAGDHGRADDGGLKGEISPQWVVKYTAVVRDRGVVENKGYIASADVVTPTEQNENRM